MTASGLGGYEAAMRGTLEHDLKKWNPPLPEKREKGKGEKGKGKKGKGKKRKKKGAKGGKRGKGAKG